jgi:hypothetical protein
MLPGRAPRAEDAYVAAWRSNDDTDGLIEVITTAIDARRPKLAARLVGLLDDHIDIEPGSPVARAQAAARMFLMNRPTAEDNSWSTLEDAWKEARKARLHRIGLRQRDRMKGETRRIGRFSRRKR